MPGAGGRRCVAGYCSNTTKDNVSLFSFPKNASIRRQWVKFVAVNRCDEWAEKDYEPSQWALLCSTHFDESCFDSSVSLKQSMGFTLPYYKKLLPDAVLQCLGRLREMLTIFLRRLS